MHFTTCKKVFRFTPPCKYGISMANKALQAGIAVIVILIVAVVLVGIYYKPVQNAHVTTTSTTHIAPSTTVAPTVYSQTSPIILTDPPVVPPNTEALTINYSSVRVHISGASAGWVNASGSGSLDLIALVNSSSVIGNAKIPANSTVNMVSFNVTYASITINGTTSSLTIPNHTITAHITGPSKVNATSGFLLDFSPTVATIYTPNSTIFVLVPSVRAIVIGGKNVTSHSSIGASERLNASVRARLEYIKPNVSIVSSSISSSGNLTTISVTVKDNSNTSVVIRHMLVFGNYSVAVRPFKGFNTTVKIGSDGKISQYGSEAFNITSIEDGNAGGNANVGTDGAGVHGSIGIGINVSSNSSSDKASSDISANSTGDNVQEDSLIREGIEAQRLRAFNFFIAPNSTMYLPSYSNEFEVNSGYNLSAGSTETFTFSGNLSFGLGHIYINAVNGTEYTLVVNGEESAMASTKVVAS